ncbi:MAG TPA: DUF1059 domain-containing protein [Bdellovibrionota bacterium]|jgi:predicted small metal-binding protein
MKFLSCRDAGKICDYVAKGDSENEVLSDAMRHGREVHGMEEEDFSPQMKEKMRSLIRDEEDYIAAS